MNTVRVGTTIRYAGELVNDLSESVATLESAGGRLRSTSTPGLAEASVQALAAKRRGNGEQAEAIMNASLDAGQVSGVSTTSVANLAALVALDDSLIEDGSIVNVVTLRTRFMLDKQSAVTAASMVILATASGTGRWVRTSDVSPSWGYQTAWYVDAQGNDSNDEYAGTSEKPLATFNEFLRRVNGRINANVTVTLLSDLETDGSDIIAFNIDARRPYLSAKWTLKIQGTPVELAWSNITSQTSTEATRDTNEGARLNLSSEDPIQGGPFGWVQGLSQGYAIPFESISGTEARCSDFMDRTGSQVQALNSYARIMRGSKVTMGMCVIEGTLNLDSLQVRTLYDGGEESQSVYLRAAFLSATLVSFGTDVGTDGVRTVVDCATISSWAEPSGQVFTHCYFTSVAFIGASYPWIRNCVASGMTFLNCRGKIERMVLCDWNQYGEPLAIMNGSSVELSGNNCHLGLYNKTTPAMIRIEGNSMLYYASTTTWEFQIYGKGNTCSSALIRCMKGGKFLYPITKTMTAAVTGDFGMVGNGVVAALPANLPIADPQTGTGILTEDGSVKATPPEWVDT
jgi:hypothetical protein